MIQKTATLQDVARIAGVSTATVSRALSNPAMVSAATREKVSQAVRQCHYRVNRAARSLRTQQAQTVLVLLPDLANPFFSSILEGISRGLSREGYSMLIASTAQIDQAGERLSDYVDDVRADGMIILDGGLTPSVVRALNGLPAPDRIIFACEWIEGLNFSSVRTENGPAVEAAITYLHDLGHVKIGHISGPQDNVLGRVRRTTYIEKCVSLGLDIREEWVISGDFTLAAGCAAAKSWLALDDRSTAVFCASDLLAFGFISELSRHRIRVPDDVSVIGFDDIDLAEHFIPALTTMRQDRPQIGETAATMLLEAIRSGNGSTRGREIAIPASLIVRESCAPLR